MSSQPFLVLDRNLIVIMKHYSHSSVKSPAFVFGTSRDNCLPFESILHNPHNNFLLRDHLLRIITWALSDSQRCRGLALLRAADKLMGKQPLLLNILSEGSETCVVRREVLHHPTQQPRHIRAMVRHSPDSAECSGADPEEHRGRKAYPEHQRSPFTPSSNN